MHTRANARTMPATVRNRFRSFHSRNISACENNFRPRKHSGNKKIAKIELKTQFLANYFHRENKKKHHI